MNLVYYKKIKKFFLLIKLNSIIPFILTCYLLLALVSFDPNDPTWLHTSLHDNDVNNDLVKNLSGKLGVFIANVLFFIFGTISYILPLIILFMYWKIFVKKYTTFFHLLENNIKTVTGFFLLILSSCAIADINFDDLYYFFSGGILGKFLSNKMLLYFDIIDVNLILIIFWFIGFTMLSDCSWLLIFERIGEKTFFCISCILRNKLIKNLLNLYINKKLKPIKIINNLTRQNHENDSTFFNIDETKVNDLFFLKFKISNIKINDTIKNISIFKTLMKKVEINSFQNRKNILNINKNYDEYYYINLFYIYKYKIYLSNLIKIIHSYSLIKDKNNYFYNLLMTNTIKLYNLFYNNALPYFLKFKTLDYEFIKDKIIDNNYNNFISINRDINFYNKINIFINVDHIFLNKYFFNFAIFGRKYYSFLISEFINFFNKITDSFTYEILKTLIKKYFIENYCLSKIDSILENFNYRNFCITNKYSYANKNNLLHKKKYVQNNYFSTPLSLENINKENLNYNLAINNDTDTYNTMHDECKKLYSKFPNIDLLNLPLNFDNKNVDQFLLKQISILVERKLADYHIKVKVVGAYSGPVITCLELDLAPGIKVSRISNLSRDLARALSVVSVRIIEVIPGKPYVGLELPNKNRQKVYLREIIDSDIFRNVSWPLALALGKDIVGKPIIVNLGDMPHLLISGTTGSGKSIAINAMIVGLLYKVTPKEVKFIMIDPKILELSLYNGIPHLLTRVITNVKDTISSLNWCINEMERRYKLMSFFGVRNFKMFNNLIEKIKDSDNSLLKNLYKKKIGISITLEKLPYIVVIIDEFADLIMTIGKKIEELIIKLVQKARAAGIHLILATQRPTVNIITGLIKANIQTRIAFTVSSKIDSRTILDQTGAESLLGMGDMLYLAPNSSSLIRIHGAFVSDEEVRSVVNYWKSIEYYNYAKDILNYNIDSQKNEGSYNNKKLDSLFSYVILFIVYKNNVYISDIQHRFHISYDRAVHIIKQMESFGMVSHSKGSDKYKVLFKLLKE